MCLSGKEKKHVVLPDGSVRVFVGLALTLVQKEGNVCWPPSFSRLLYLRADHLTAPVQWAMKLCHTLSHCMLDKAFSCRLDYRELFQSKSFD